MTWSCGTAWSTQRSASFKNQSRRKRWFAKFAKCSTRRAAYQVETGTLLEAGLRLVPELARQPLTEASALGLRGQRVTGRHHVVRGSRPGRCRRVDLNRVGPDTRAI